MLIINVNNNVTSAVRDTLESRGVLDQLKARLRAEVFSALEDRSEPRPPLSHHNLLINQLVGDYLEFNQYRHAASVLKAGEFKPETARDSRLTCSEFTLLTHLLYAGALALNLRTYCMSYLLIVLRFVALYPSYPCCIRGMG